MRALGEAQVVGGGGPARGAVRRGVLVVRALRADRVDRALLELSLPADAAAAQADLPADHARRPATGAPSKPPPRRAGRHPARRRRRRRRRAPPRRRSPAIRSAIPGPQQPEDPSAAAAADADADPVPRARCRRRTATSPRCRVADRQPPAARGRRSAAIMARHGPLRRLARGAAPGARCSPSSPSCSAVTLDESFFQDWGWLAGPGVWAALRARRRRGAAAAAGVGARSARRCRGLPSLATVLAGVHWAGTPLALILFGAVVRLDRRAAPERGRPATASAVGG